MTVEDFDFSDCVLKDDSVREIIDLAVEVLRDHAPDHANTRIERLARWIIFNLSPELQDSGAGMPVVEISSDLMAWRQGTSVGLRCEDPLTPVTARQLATALLICSEGED